jgi:hypothetical protein
VLRSQSPPNAATKKSSLKLAHPLCRKLSSASDGSERWPVMSASHVWQSLRNELLNASYATQDTDNERFRPWVTELFDLYTTDRMERSLAFPASSATMRHILQIIDDYPTNKEPLQILVMGGSVTAGNGYIREDKTSPRGNRAFFSCAWPTRLKFLLNTFFFRRRTCRQSHQPCRWRILVRSGIHDIGVRTLSQNLHFAARCSLRVFCK